MEAAAVRSMLSLVAPSVLLVFACAFAVAWFVEQRLRYLLYFAAACALFAAGAASQIFKQPANIGLNAMLSGALYLSAVLAAANGLLDRSGRAWHWQTLMGFWFASMLPLWYFFYVDRSLIARIYLQNFGYGLVLVAATTRLTELARGKAADRVLFWILLIFAVQFFPRTYLTLAFGGPIDTRAFGTTFFWQALQLSIAVLGVSLALAVLATAFSDILESVRTERDTDSLTGLLSRRRFQEIVFSQLERRKQPLALALCDVDHFKQVNDTYGHHAGDEVLRAVAAVLQGKCRKKDVVARLGGEEFAVLFPDTMIQEAREISERLRQAIASLNLPIQQNVTASFGVASFGPHDNWESVFRRADANLYRAKDLGRNAVHAENEQVA